MKKEIYAILVFLMLLTLLWIAIFGFEILQNQDKILAQQKLSLQDTTIAIEALQSDLNDISDNLLIIEKEMLKIIKEWEKLNLN